MKRINQVDFDIEYSLREIQSVLRLTAIWIHSEETEVVAEIENVETLFVRVLCYRSILVFLEEEFFVRTHDVNAFADAGTASNHLPEFDFGVDSLEEDKI